jgi:predicted HicB family RNase H-like nuclease
MQELKNSFHEVVSDYLNYCKERDKELNKVISLKEVKLIIRVS